MPENDSVNGRLDSWKEIADYLRRDVRTVTRWEKDKRLPVHRVPGGKRQAVFAYRQELDAWLLSQEPNGDAKAVLPEKRFRWQPFLFVGVAVSALIIFLVLERMLPSHTIRRVQVPARIVFTSNSIQALDDRGGLLWTHGFSKTLQHDPRESLEDLVRIVDLYNDGEREVLVVAPLHSGPNSSDLVTTEIDCFSSQGELLWSYVPQEQFQFGDHKLEGPWDVFDVFVTPGATHAIWAAFAHYRWGNSFVVQLNPKTGKDTVRFVNTGIIYKLNEARISGKTYLLAGAFNNEYAAGSLAVLDEARVFAVSPQTPGTRHKCVSCSEGMPDYYFVFPRSEINTLKNLWENPVRGIDVHPEEIEIRKDELASPEMGEKPSAAATMYLFRTGPTIHLVSLRFDSTYDMVHRDLERHRALDHSLATCPERLHPGPVRMWTASNGWTELRLAPMKPSD
jgi:hypothetical protein